MPLKIINNLVKRGFVTSELKYQKGTQIVEKRILKISRWYKSTSKRTERSAKITYIPIFEEPKIGDNDVKKKKIFETDSDPYLLAKFLEKCITENNPKFPQNESQRQRWAKDFDLMIPQRQN